jgi:hypothetical protein
MKTILFAAALLIAGIQARADEPAALPMSSVEVFRIAPGQHENFLKMLAQIEALGRQAGLNDNELYIHDSGASWDFILIKRHGQDPKKYAALVELMRKAQMPSGPDYFFESRKMFAWHEDTEAIGPTTATDYLATRKQK